MAMRFVDSFDHYATAQLPTKWTNPGSATIQAVTVRHGIQALAVPMAGTTTCFITIDPQGTWIVGFGFRSTGFPAGINRATILTIEDGGVGTQARLMLKSDGTLEIQRGAGAAVVATSVRSIAVNTWYYFEFKHIIANAGGTLEVRVNEEVWATFAGDTQETANATANVISLGAGGSLGTGHLFDDLYILDGTGGAPNNAYWGDTQVDCIVPDGNGFYQEFATLVGAATHWQAVSEIPPNADTSYVAENVVNDRDTFTFPNLSVASAVINGIQVSVSVREDTAGGAHLARMFRSGGVDDQGADYAMNTSYHYWLREIMALDPIAAGAWTVANINAAEFGFRVR